MPNKARMLLNVGTSVTVMLYYLYLYQCYLPSRCDTESEPAVKVQAPKLPNREDICEYCEAIPVVMSSSRTLYLVIWKLVDCICQKELYIWLKLCSVERC